MGLVAQLPSRLSRLTARQQHDALKSLSTRELLAALALKYPDCTWTADELDRARGYTVTVKPTGDNEWVVIPHAPAGPGN